MKYLLTAVLLLSCYTLPAQHHVVRATDEFRVTVNIKNEKIFHIAGLMKYKQDAIGDIIVKNHRGELKDTLKAMKGILLKQLLDSVEIITEKPKEYSEYYMVFTAADGYKNVYSWNEVFNTDIGNHIYIITEMNGKQLPQMEQRVLVMSLGDVNTGRRHLKGLTKIEFKKVE